VAAAGVTAGPVAGVVPVKGSDGLFELATTTGATTQVGSSMVWGMTQPDGVEPAAPAVPADRSTMVAPTAAPAATRLVQAVTRMPTL